MATACSCGLNDDFDAAIARVAELKAEIIQPRHRNPPDGNGGPNHWECWVARS